MTVGQISSIVAACIVSAGGVGGVILAVVKFSSNLIANHLSTSYENKLQKEMEKLKTELNRKEYISKTRFDTEFEIYRNLCHAFFTLVRDINGMIPTGYTLIPAKEEAQIEQENESFKVANHSIVKAQDALYANGAFITQLLFDGFDEILRLCRQQIHIFSFRYNVLTLETEKEKRTLSTDDYQRTAEINQKWYDHINEIRAYLSTIDVI